MNAKRRSSALSAFIAAAIVAGAGTLLAEETPAKADETIVARWPADGASDQDFDGNRFLPVPKLADAGEGAFTVSVWVRADDLGRGDVNYGRGIARSTRDGKIGDWLLAVHPDGRVRFCNWRIAAEDKSGGHITVDAVISPDVWHQIVAAWDGQTNHLFVDGKEVKYNDVTTAAGWGTAHEVGRSWTQPGYYWSGQIDELLIRSRAMAGDEIGTAFASNPRSKNPAFDFEIRLAGDASVSAAIDREILARLTQQQIEPAPPADDVEFLRRVTLDLAGRIPTVAENEAFLADDSPDKRSHRIDALLSSREMPYYWSQVLSNWLMPEASRRDEGFVSYLRGGLAKNKLWDRFAREMLVARPSGDDDQFADRFLTLREEALKDQTIGRDVGRALLGVNLRCAQCHDHPDVPKWTHNRFFELSAFFARSYVHQYKIDNQQLTAVGEHPAGEMKYTAAGGKQIEAKPVFLDGSGIEEAEAPPQENPKPDNAAPPPVPPFSRRAALADLVLNPNSPYFKRAMVNRVWRELMGRGLVEPVDMMHEENPPSHPALLDLLADDFAQSGFDLKRLVAVIMHSEAYARSSRWEGQSAPEETLYAAAVLKPMNADQLALSLPLAVGAFDDRIGARLSHGLARVRPLAPDKELLAMFDSPQPLEPTTEQTLFLLNGDSLQKYVQSDSRLVKQLAEAKDDAQLVHRAYTSILSRPATTKETSQATDYLSARGQAHRADACGELVWALLTGAEFRFNH